MVDKSVTGVYRPVSLSSYVVMVMECMVHQQLTWVLESRNFTSNGLCGLWCYRYAIDHLV